MQKFNTKKKRNSKDTSKDQEREKKRCHYSAKPTLLQAQFIFYLFIYMNL